MNRRRPPKRLFVIGDRDALSREISSAIEHKANGNTSAAARVARMRQPELHRLKNGQIGSIGRKAIEGLHRLVPPHRRAALQACLVSPAALEFIHANESWSTQSRRRFLERGGLGDTPAGRAVQSVLGWEFQRGLERDHLLRLCREEFPDLFERFERFLQQYAHSASRAKIAFDRILEPLLESRESGFVERSWEELTTAELRRDVKAGMDRERILLRRSPDLQRAQQQATRDPVDLIRLYGQLWDIRAFMGRSTHPLMRAYIQALRRQR